MQCSGQLDPHCVSFGSLCFINRKRGRLHLVTGGSGFLGNLIARRLHAAGQPVRILDLWDDPTRPDGIDFVPADIRDRSSVAAAMRGVSVVHHNVALVPLTKAENDYRSVNIEGSRIAAEEAVRAGVESFIHMSSSAIYGAPVCPVTEETPTGPLEPYGRAKLEGEQAVLDAASGSMRVVAVRPRTILGSGRLGIYQILFEWIRQGRRIPIIGDGSNPLQFVHAHDLMDAYLLLLEKGWSGPANIGTDRFGTLQEDLEALIAAAGTASRIVHLPSGPTIASLRALDRARLSPLAAWHYLTYDKPFHFDVTPLLSEGWRPKYSNAEMLIEAYEEYVAGRVGASTIGAPSPHRRPVREGVIGLVRRML